MAIIKIEFSTDNAAFEDDYHGELNDVLAAITESVNQTRNGRGKVRDSNGNTIGKWIVGSEPHEPVGALLPDGSVCAWDERLQSVGATPLYL